MRHFDRDPSVEVVRGDQEGLHLEGLEMEKDTVGF
jgi:hypothetical protein